MFLIALHADTTTSFSKEDGTGDGEPLRGMAAHVAQLQLILSNQVKETQYLRRMIENFHFTQKTGV
jgi:hypothetical protein